MVYVIGGWTGAHFEARNVTDNAFYQPSETFWANGWTAGAGVERKLSSNWSVRAEYRYTDFGTVRTNDAYAFNPLPVRFAVIGGELRQKLEPAFVEVLPVGKFHGIGPATSAKMNSLGLYTGLDMRNQTLEFMQANFCEAGACATEGHLMERSVVPKLALGDVRSRALAGP